MLELLSVKYDLKFDLSSTRVLKPKQYTCLFIFLGKLFSYLCVSIVCEPLAFLDPFHTGLPDSESPFPFICT